MTISRHMPSPSRAEPAILAVLLLLLPTFSSTSELPSYYAHCAAAVTQYTPTTAATVPVGSFEFYGGHFSGGRLSSEPFLPLDPYSFATPSVSLRSRSIRQTSIPGVLDIKADVFFRDGRFGLSLRRRGGRNVTDISGADRVQMGRRERVSYFRRATVRFDLSGAWSESSGRLCMVGAGTRSLSGNVLQLRAVFNLDYPNSSNIANSIVNGTIESLDSLESPNYFDPIYIVAYAQKSYEFTKIADAKESCDNFLVPMPEPAALALESAAFCSRLQTHQEGNFLLEYSKDCGGDSDCNGAPIADRSLGFSPTSMYVKKTACSGANRELHMYVSFSNRTGGYNRGSGFVPERTLVAEGFWDDEKKRLCAIACRAVNVTDCSIGMCFWFPSALSIDHRSTIVGRLWSNKKKGEPGYFGEVSLANSGSRRGNFSVSGLTYRYTKLDAVDESCMSASATQNSEKQQQKKRYPDGRSAGDMRFSLVLKDPNGWHSWGSASPFALGESLLDGDYAAQTINEEDAKSSTLNVSYDIILTNSSLSSDGRASISAEGFYNTATGRLCMVGCRSVGRDSLPMTLQPSLDGPKLDCKILIDVQLPSLNPESKELSNGMVRSSRPPSDPLYFGAMEAYAYSMSNSQALQSIWRMDVEITMVLVSQTLSCVFILAQLFHVWKHPVVAASMSVTMLLVLTFGHMVPLVLNFEAMLVTSPGKQNLLWWSGGWLEANEILVRLVTMVAFLLQFRLLLAVRAARLAPQEGDEERKKGLRAAERKALRLCLPLYFVGALIAWFVHSEHTVRSNNTGFDIGTVVSLRKRSIWEDLRAYGGLILDSFLLPQFLLNLFLDSKDYALSPVFYVGTTIGRAVPHLYDLYRARRFLPFMRSASFIYADPNSDLYSVAWDVFIPCMGTLFAVLIAVQQRLGGARLIPTRFQKKAAYESVPTTVGA